MAVDLAAAGYALFVWWFSTAAIILLDNLPRRTFRWSMAVGTVLFAVSLWRLAGSAHDTSIAGAYAAFTYAIIAWGWQEMSFFMGFVTGPRRTGARPHSTLGERFADGLAACLYHELAIVVTAAIIVAITWGAPNQAGAWTFIALWTMRQSAKLNVFLGVRNLGERFVPIHLQYLLTYMAKRPMNALMPLSITGGTVATVLFAQRAGVSAPSVAAAYTFLVTILALAVLEHWMLVLPLPFERLWTWVLNLRPGIRLSGPSPRRQWNYLSGSSE